MSDDRTIQVDFEAAINGSEVKTKFQAEVTFTSHEAMLKRAGESTIRLMQTRARGNKFPSGRRVPVTVNEKGELEFTISSAEKAARLTDQEAEELFEALRKRQEAKMAALTELTKDESKTVAVKPHTH